MSRRLGLLFSVAVVLSCRVDTSSPSFVERLLTQLTTDQRDNGVYPMTPESRLDARKPPSCDIYRDNRRLGTGGRFLFPARRLPNNKAANVDEGAFGKVLSRCSR